MQYSFQSAAPHNFRSIFIRQLPRFIWPLVFLGAMQYFFPESAFTKNNWHIYSMLAGEVFGLYNVLSDDSVNELVVDMAKKKIVLNCYNIYQGQFEQTLPFSNLRVNIETDRKGKTDAIDFYIGKRHDYTLRKKKDNFTQHNMDDLKELLYSVTSPKK